MRTSWDQLALPLRLDIAKEEIEGAFRERSAAAHPDGGGSAGEFEKIREARNALLEPASRLTQWLECHHIEPTHSGIISNEIGKMFERVGTVTQAVDAWSGKGTKITSGLGKALWQKEGLQWKEQVEVLLNEVSDWQASLVESFPELQRAAEENTFEKAIATRNELGFLRKWQSELQSRFGKIWEGLI